MPSNAKATKQDESSTITLKDPNNPNFSVTLFTNATSLSLDEQLRQPEPEATASNTTTANAEQHLASRSLSIDWSNAVQPTRQDSGELRRCDNFEGNRTFEEAYDFARKKFNGYGTISPLLAQQLLHALALDLTSSSLCPTPIPSRNISTASPLTISRVPSLNGPTRDHSLQAPSTSRTLSTPPLLPVRSLSNISTDTPLPPAHSPTLSNPVIRDQSFEEWLEKCAQRPADESDSDSDVEGTNAFCAALQKTWHQNNTQPSNNKGNKRQALTGADDKPIAKAFTRPESTPVGLFDPNSKFLREAQDPNYRRQRKLSRRAQEAKEAQQQSNPSMSR